MVAPAQHGMGNAQSPRQNSDPGGLFRGLGSQAVIDSCGDNLDSFRVEAPAQSMQQGDRVTAARYGNGHFLGRCALKARAHLSEDIGVAETQLHPSLDIASRDWATAGAAGKRTATSPSVMQACCI